MPMSCCQILHGKGTMIYLASMSNLWVIRLFVYLYGAFNILHPALLLSLCKWPFIHQLSGFIFLAVACCWKVRRAICWWKLFKSWTSSVRCNCYWLVWILCYFNYLLSKYVLKVGYWISGYYWLMHIFPLSFY